jgi:predicted TIM-barrel fold metal-dependent hydrolase
LHAGESSIFRITMAVDLPWQAQSHDREFAARELASFLPPEIYDAHAHVWPAGALRMPDLPLAADADEMAQLTHGLHPESRMTAALMIPFPTSAEKVAASNEWVAAQVMLGGANYRGLFLVQPTDDPEWVRGEVRRLGLHGLKCYHTYAASRPTWEAEIPDYLPERLVKVADDEGWVITLHLVRARSVADPGNLHWITHYCRRYPNMRLILAHSARGFQPSHNFEGLPQLAGLENLYFDSSANCEPMAHLAVIRMMGHDRLLYGSDFPISHLRGRSVAAADSFLWLYGNTPVWGENHMKIDPVLVGLEHLRSLKWACWAARLSDSQVQDVFSRNAQRVLGVKPSGDASRSEAGSVASGRPN